MHPNVLKTSYKPTTTISAGTFYPLKIGASSLKLYGNYPATLKETT